MKNGIHPLSRGKFTVLGSALVSLAFLTGAQAQVQQARRIAIYSFDDIASSRGQQIGQKLGDRLLSKLADSGVYQIIDRQFLEKILREQQLPAGRFDASTAVTIGKLVNVAAIVDGTITTYTSNSASSHDANAVYGAVTVAATARLISTETGAILKAPSASETARGAVQLKPQPQAQRSCRQVPFVGPVCTNVPAPAPPTIETQTMEQLLDEAIESCARTLASALAEASSRVANSAAVATNPNPLPPMASPATVIGVTDGITYINRGVNAGMRIGLVLQVYRVVPSGLTDPTDGRPLTRKAPVCTLTLNDVEDRNSSGRCAGSPAANGDGAEVRVQ